MNSSLTITKIAAALVKAQLEMSNAVKDATNPFFNKKYADLAAVREACLPALNKFGISAIQPTCVVEGINYVETILLHESGEFISSFTPIITANASDPQKHGSGLSYARRYALQSMVNIGVEDDDANNAMPKPPITYTAAQLTAAKKTLTDAKDFATLGAAWVNVNEHIKPALLAYKDELKVKFKTPVQITQENIAK